MQDTGHPDRRDGVRVDVRTDVHVVAGVRGAFHGGGGVAGPASSVARTVNVSRGGAYLESSNVPKEGSRVVLEFTEPGADERLILQADVRWRNVDQLTRMPRGFGVELQFESEAQEGAWQRFMETIVQQ